MLRNNFIWVLHLGMNGLTPNEKSGIKKEQAFQRVRLDSVNSKSLLRSQWPHEALNFTRWLAEPENLELLGDELGIGIKLQADRGERRQVQRGHFGAGGELRPAHHHREPA